MSLPDFSTRAHAAARTVAADALVAEVVPALRAAGVPPVLLKGASLVGWLYDVDEGRVYGDVDILVAPDRRHAAQEVLRSLGFELEPPRPPAKHHPKHARTWHRERDDAAVDLHRTLPGIRTAPEEVWRVLCEDLERRDVYGTEVEVLGVPGRTLLVALHIAHHVAEPTSGMIRKPMADLRLALDRLPESAWREATALATRLHCRERLSAGLRADPRGDELAERLGLPAAEWVEGGPKRPTTAAFERLGALPDWRAKLRMAARMLLPSPAVLRWQSRLATRGPLGLAAAYLLRPVWLLVSGIPGLLEWRRLRRAGRKSG